MGLKPFEVAAECAMAGLPTGMDIARVSEELEKARRRAPGIVRATVQAPAVFRDRAYVLDSRFVVWADDGDGAVEAVGNLLHGASITHRNMHLSGRALAEADVPRPGGAARAPREAVPARARSSSRSSAKGKVKARASKPARKASKSRASARPGARGRSARGRTARGPREPAAARRKR